MANMYSIILGMNTIFAKRLALVMEEKNISNAELAEKIYATPSCVSGYRTGRRMPRVPELVRISQSLEVSVDYLVGLKDNQDF